MNMQKKEYKVENFPFPTNRVCLTLDLKENPELIAQYKHYHSKEAFWTEIGEGIQKAGIQLMDIYNIDNRLFMICEFAEELDFETIWNKVGDYNRQEEWGQLMSNYIQALPGHKLGWIKMTRVFSIYK